MADCARVTSKGQITVPKAIRSEMELRRGDLVLFEPCEHGMLLKKAALAPVIDIEKLTRELTYHLRQREVRAEDVEDAVRWSRNESSCSTR